MAVREYLKSRYPDEELPNIYFMNPKGFKAREDLTVREVEDVARDAIWKDDVSESPWQVRSREEVMEEFEKTYKRLLRDKHKPVLVFDTCLHSGNSLYPVKRFLEDSGFIDARMGSINPSPSYSRVRTDFHVTTKDPEKGCYPFDRDRIIEKTFDHVYSKRTDDQAKREKSVKLRREIQRIIKEQLPKEVSY